LGIVNANLLEAMHTILAMMDPLRITLKKGSSGKVKQSVKILFHNSEMMNDNGSTFISGDSEQYVHVARP
jgi:hypothetical protein